MKRANSFRFLVAGAVVAAVGLLGARAFATDASDIFTYANVNDRVVYNNDSGDFPIVTAVASQPGTLNGHLYTFWTVLLQDTSGSLAPNFSGFTLTNLMANPNATINVGDKINMAGQWGPYHQIPEIGLSTVPASNNYWKVVSTGNSDRKRVA